MGKEKISWTEKSLNLQCLGKNILNNCIRSFIGIEAKNKDYIEL